MSDDLPFPTALPPLSATKARDIARGHLALAEQYRIAEMRDVAAEYDRQARLWLAYARTLVAVGTGADPNP